MDCYGRNKKKRDALKAAQEEMEICAEHYDLVLLMTLREEYNHGAKWLKDFYKKFVAKYKYYQNRYLTENESTRYGNRTDAYAMKKRLKEIGFDYDAVCEEIMNEEE